MVIVAWTQEGEWHRNTITAGPSGWVLEHVSRVSGTMSGGRTLIKYGGDFPRGCDLNRAWNETATYGEALFEGCGKQGASRVLRHGRKVF